MLGNIDVYFQILTDERNLLKAAINAARSNVDPVELDQQVQGRLSRIAPIERQELARAVASRRYARLRQVDAALERIAKGQFGYCIDCGNEIEDARLHAEVCVLKCADCVHG